MFFLIFAILLILIATALYYQTVIKPKQLMNFYIKQFQPQFKVVNLPFAPLKAAQFQFAANTQNKTKDVFSYYKDTMSEFDVAISNIAHKIQIHLISPKLIQAYHQLDLERYYVKYDLLIQGLRKMVGTGLTFSVGQEWKMKRRVITKMLNFAYIKTLVPKIEGIVQRKTEDLISKATQSKTQGYHELDLLHLTTDIGSTVILQLFFGGGGLSVNQIKICDTPLNQYMRILMQKLQVQILDPTTLVLGQKFVNLGLRKMDRQVNVFVKQFKQFTKHYVEKRLQQLKITYEQGKAEPEFYTDLIEAFYVQQIIKKKATITAVFVQSIIDDFATLYTAGTDTTSHTTQMAIYYLVSHPQVYNKLKLQITTKITNIKEITFQSFKHCVYLQAVLLQTLRMYSTANGIFPRQVTQDHWLTVNQKKYLIKKGTLINTTTYPTQYKQTIYKNAKAFNPDRFVTADSKIIATEPFTLNNFSAGHRSCVGRQLAMTEMKGILATLISLYQFKVDDVQKEMIFEEFAYNMKGVKFQIKPIE